MIRGLGYIGRYRDWRVANRPKATNPTPTVVSKNLPNGPGPGKHTGGGVLLEGSASTNKALFTTASTRDGSVSWMAAARMLFRAREVRPAASGPFPHTSPMLRPQVWLSIGKTS
jgi:hypothetical protein